jgi:hypothetical protein
VKSPLQLIRQADALIHECVDVYGFTRNDFCEMMNLLLDTAAHHGHENHKAGGVQMITIGVVCDDDNTHLFEAFVEQLGIIQVGATYKFGNSCSIGNLTFKKIGSALATRGYTFDGVLFLTEPTEEIRHQLARAMHPPSEFGVR